MQAAIEALLGDIGVFSRVGIRTHPLRPYQIAPVEAVLRSVREGQGHQFAWVFSRQAGKDETKAQLYAFLLAHFQLAGGQIVEANPTFKPQCLTAKQRLLDRARSCVLTRRAVGQEGYKVRLGNARVVYLSAEPNANVRGETASLLLVCNEMQDVGAVEVGIRVRADGGVHQRHAPVRGHGQDLENAAGAEDSGAAGDGSAGRHTAGVPDRLGRGGA